MKRKKLFRALDERLRTIEKSLQKQSKPEKGDVKVLRELVEQLANILRAFNYGNNATFLLERTQRSQLKGPADVERLRVSFRQSAKLIDEWYA